MPKIALAALALTCAASPALAQSASDGPSGDSGGWAFSYGAATDNRSKSASKSQGDPFAYGLAEWESADGRFYAGPGFETVRSNGSNLELRAGAGYRPQIMGFDIDLNATHKWLVDADPGTDDQAWEFTASASRSIGPASARLRVQHSPEHLGSTRAFTWTDARIGWAFTDRLSGSATLGYRDQDNAPDYTGWDAGVTYALTEAIDLDVRWFDTDADVPGPQFDGALVAGINLYF